MKMRHRKVKFVKGGVARSNFLIGTFLNAFDMVHQFNYGERHLQQHNSVLTVDEKYLSRGHRRINIDLHTQRNQSQEFFACCASGSCRLHSKLKLREAVLLGIF